MLFIDYVNVLFSSNSQPTGWRNAWSRRCLSIMSMFSFQAIHNTRLAHCMRVNVVYRLCQCSLFKQFTTIDGADPVQPMLFIDYVNVLFSSNSQPIPARTEAFGSCLSIMSMFSFQAIHNSEKRQSSSRSVVYRLCQCSLFKQFTTAVNIAHQLRPLFIDYVNVLFSSNSQRWAMAALRTGVVYRLCQCSLFKQFTTTGANLCGTDMLFIDYVNVLFSSNSQLKLAFGDAEASCLSIMSMFSFQAIHNHGCCRITANKVVYRLCQCSLFKQFTTD